MKINQLAKYPLALGVFIWSSVLTFIAIFIIFITLPVIFIEECLMSIQNNRKFEKSLQELNEIKQFLKEPAIAFIQVIKR